MRKEPLILEADDQNKTELSLEDTSTFVGMRRVLLLR